MPSTKCRNTLFFEIDMYTSSLVCGENWYDKSSRAEHTTLTTTRGGEMAWRIKTEIVNI
jgi:hypothetical protein